MNKFAEFLPQIPNKDQRAEISADAQVALWDKELPRDHVVDSITELALRQYALLDPEEGQSLADLTARAVLLSFGLRDRRLMADKLCSGIEEAFSLINEVTPCEEQSSVQYGANDEYSELESIPTL